MFSLLQTTFLRSPATVYFMDDIVHDAQTPEEAMKTKKDCGLHENAKRVNEDVWFELKFALVKSIKASRNEEFTYEKLCNDLCTLILKFADITAGLGHSSDVMAKDLAQYVL